MGGVCCCCCDDDEYFHHRERRTRTVPGPASRGATQQQSQQSQQRVQRPDQCRICGRTIDPSLIDGHEESCRAQARKRMREEQQHQQQQNQSPGSNSGNHHHHHHHSDTEPLRPNDQHHHEQNYNTRQVDVSEDDPEHQCVICLDNKKVVAILPCAHLCACLNCAKMIDSCPMCRGPKDSLLVINENAGKCRVCKHFVAPVYLDAHQEVCRLRMKELRKKLRDEQEKSDANLLMRAQSGNNNNNNSSEPNLLQPHSSTNHAVASAEGMCLNCLVRKREKFNLPCGHATCDECSKNSSTCPVCLGKIAARITVYD